MFFEQKGSSTPGFNRSGTGVYPDFTFNSAHGDECYLFKANEAGTILGFRKGVQFGAAANGVSFGRYVNSVGSEEFAKMHGAEPNRRPECVSNPSHCSL